LIKGLSSPATFSSSSRPFIIGAGSYYCEFGIYSGVMSSFASVTSAVYSDGYVSTAVESPLSSPSSDGTSDIGRGSSVIIAGTSSTNVS